jgi:hypothetical protein
MKNWKLGFVVVAIIAIFGFAACGGGGGGDPEYITVTKDVEVTFPEYTSGQTTLNLTVASYTPKDGWGEHFSASDITYTVTCTELSKSYPNGTGITIASGPYANFTIYTFTQTFKLPDETTKSQVIKVAVAGDTFWALKDTDDTNLDPQVIPSISLTLSKEVEK